MKELLKQLESHLSQRPWNNPRNAWIWFRSRLDADQYMSDRCVGPRDTWNLHKTLRIVPIPFVLINTEMSIPATVLWFIFRDIPEIGDQWSAIVYQQTDLVLRYSPFRDRDGRREIATVLEIVIEPPWCWNRGLGQVFIMILYSSSSPPPFLKTRDQWRTKESIEMFPYIIFEKYFHPLLRPGRGE